MNFTFTVNVQLDRAQGKFATRDEMETQLVEALEGANPEELEGENEGQYTVVEWEVST